MIRDWWIWIRFVCFVFQGSLLCDRPVSENNQLVQFASQIILIFLILVTCNNKATSASFHRHKIHSQRRFPSLFLSSWAVLARYMVICINPAFTKMIDRAENPESLHSLQYPQRGTMNFAVIDFKSTVGDLVLWVRAQLVHPVPKIRGRDASGTKDFSYLYGPR